MQNLIIMKGLNEPVWGFAICISGSNAVYSNQGDSKVDNSKVGGQ